MSVCRTQQQSWKGAVEIIYVSPTERTFNGKRFVKFGHYYRSSRKFLHRAVWEFHHGEIPDGHHIHHKDGDRENNAIENLEAVPAHEHISGHHTGHGRRPVAALAALVDWRKSDVGKQRQRQGGLLNIKYLRAATVTFKCEQCGAESTKTKVGANRFCSAKCKSKWRREQGLDDVERCCEGCGGRYLVNRYKATRFCSKKCSGAANGELRIGVPRGHPYKKR